MSESREQAPEMSTPATLSGIFFEPGRTFEALRARPRFLAAALLCVALFMGYYLLYMTRVGYENIVNAELDVRAQSADMTEEQKAMGRDIQLKPVVKAIRYGSPALVVVVVIAAGAAIYMLGVMAMGKRVGYKQALAVWSYSGLPPLLLRTLANVLILSLRPPDLGDSMAVARGLNGLVHANPGAFMSSGVNPVLVTALSSLDLFQFYGLYLAALGLRKIGRLSSGAAWGIVLGLWLLRLIGSLVISGITHTPVG